MTIAEKIKRSTKPLSLARVFMCYQHSVKRLVLLSSLHNTNGIGAAEYTFIDGSKLVCRVYW